MIGTLRKRVERANGFKRRGDGVRAIMAQTGVAEVTGKRSQRMADFSLSLT